MTVRINKQKINLREKLTEFEDKVNFDEVVRGLGEYTGNVGIGTTNPGASLTLKKDGARMVIESADYENILIGRRGSSGDSLDQGYFRMKNQGTNTIILDTAGNSYFNGGNVGIGTTNPGFPLTVHQGASGSLASDFVHESNNQPYGIRIRFTAASPDNKVNYFLKCQELANQKMVVWSNGDIETALGNSIGTLSDIRTKDSVVDATPKLSDVMKLRVVNFTRKNDPDKTKLIGFVAQEVEEVFPRFVASGDNREYDEDGNVVSGFEDVKSVKFDSGFAILTKAIQEQQSIIEDLKSRIETLESK